MLDACSATVSSGPGGPDPGGWTAGQRQHQLVQPLDEGGGIVELATFGQAGSVVTAGGVVFVGSGSNVAGYFYAYDARTGEPLWKFNTGSGIFSSPAVYMVNGEEFVAVASGGGDRGRRGGDLILSFALPKR